MTELKVAHGFAHRGRFAVHENFCAHVQVVAAATGFQGRKRNVFLIRFKPFNIGFQPCIVFCRNAFLDAGEKVSHIFSGQLLAYQFFQFRRDSIVRHQNAPQKECHNQGDDDKGWDALNNNFGLFVLVIHDVVSQC